MPEGRTVLYASVGAELIHFDVDVAGAALSRRGSVSAPANVQYAWPHASRDFLYVASSDSASGMGPAGRKHDLTAFRIDRESGALSAHGAPVPLPHRPIHMATDIPSKHALIAFNNPPAVRVYKINADSTPGVEVAQPSGIDPGIFPHQVLAMPDNKHIILVARGHDAADGKPEEPGSLKVFRNDAGVLRDELSIAPNGGFGFGPRHLDFHPARPWIYVSLERQNALAMFPHDDGRLTDGPAFQVTTLMEPESIRGRQLVGTVHVHPGGRFVYVANRASGTVEKQGTQVFAGGENSIAVFAIEQTTGEPRPIGHFDTRGIHCRTFHIDPTGKVMVCAHIMGLPLQDGTEIKPRLTLFRIDDDGKLSFVRGYDIETNGRFMWWMGMVTI
jgi:6-phosphogluconolactonase (cycloisomerase 2 family)